MKNAFLRYFPDIFVYVEKGLYEKAKVNFKIYDVTNQESSNCNNIYCSISQEVNKDNQKIKFGQFIEYNMRSTCLEKSYTKCGKETSPRLFSKKSKSSLSLDQQPKYLYHLFLLFVEAEIYKKVFKLRVLTSLSHIKLFEKTKRIMELVSLPHFFS